MKKNVLWFEDGARDEGLRLVSPVNISRRYQLTIATTASDAVAEIKSREFDAIVVDIRLEPGTHPAWAKVYQEARSSKIKARLGIQLLYRLLKHNDKEMEISLRGILHWATQPSRYGILSVESLAMVRDDLKALGIPESQYREKSPMLPVTALLELFDEITGFTPDRD